jgi:hypothetical protein
MPGPITFFSKGFPGVEWPGREAAKLYRLYIVRPWNLVAWYLIKRHLHFTRRCLAVSQMAKKIPDLGLTLCVTDAQRLTFHGANPRGRYRTLLCIPMRWLCPFWNWLSWWLLVWMGWRVQLKASPAHTVLGGSLSYSITETPENFAFCSTLENGKSP